MSQRKVIEDYEKDISFMFDSLKELVGAYRALIAAASDANGIALASKKDVKETLKTARKVECIIDRLVCSVDHVMYSWDKYIDLKSEYIEGKVELSSIQNEVDEAIRHQI